MWSKTIEMILLSLLWLSFHSPPSLYLLIIYLFFTIFHIETCLAIVL